jgi:hypothetical protein
MKWGWFAFGGLTFPPGPLVDLGASVRELAHLRAKELPNLLLQLLALKCYQLYRLGEILQKCLYLGHIGEFERFFFHVRLKPKNTRVACRDTPNTNEARDFRNVKAPRIPRRQGAIWGGVWSPPGACLFLLFLLRPYLAIETPQQKKTRY